jgi:hypothetical protein
MIYLIATALLAIGGYFYWKKNKPNSYMPPLPTTLRTDILYWYYISDDNTPKEVSDHVNFIMEYNGSTLDDLVAKLKSYSLPVALMISQECFGGMNSATLSNSLEDNLRKTFDRLRDEGLLSRISILYPIDEPDGKNITNEVMIECLKRVKAVVSQYAELANVKYAVIYSTHMTYPGITEYDIVGMDKYGVGSNVLISKEFKRMLELMNENQRYILIPGGADPWRQDPEAFRRHAHSDPKCLAIVPFLWIDYYENNQNNLGIKNNPMRDKYIALGKELTGK